MIIVLQISWYALFVYSHITVCGTAVMTLHQIYGI